MRSLRVLPEAEEELAEAAEWYESKRVATNKAVEIVAVAHAKRRPGYWVGRVRRRRGP